MTVKKYKKKRFTISIDAKLANQLDKVKKYPKWRGNKSQVVEEAIRQFLETK